MWIWSFSHHFKLFVSQTFWRSFNGGLTARDGLATRGFPQCVPRLKLEPVWKISCSKGTIGLCVHVYPRACVRTHPCVQASTSVDERSQRHQCGFASVRLRHGPSHQPATWKLVSGRWNFNVEMGTMIFTFQCAQKAEPIERQTRNNGSIINASRCELSECVCVCTPASTCPLLCVPSWCVLCGFVFVCLFTRLPPPPTTTTTLALFSDL